MKILDFIKENKCENFKENIQYLHDFLFDYAMKFMIQTHVVIGEVRTCLFSNKDVNLAPLIITISNCTGWTLAEVHVSEDGTMVFETISVYPKTIKNKIENCEDFKAKREQIWAQLRDRHSEL